MQLDPHEMRIIEAMRAHPTAQFTVVMVRGRLMTLKTELDAEIIDRAEGKSELWKKGGAIRLDGHKPA